MAEGIDRWTTPILHVDMDAFFVEVERRARTELIGVPVIVGGLGNRGVVASCSYEARAFGIHSAMPTATARRLCPHAEFVAPTMGSYQEYSVRVFEILRSVTPLVEPLSVDEGFLDVSGLTRHHDSPQSVARLIRKEIRSALDLPASVGVAPNKFLAKLASNSAKPDGVFTVEADRVAAFLQPLSVRALWGVGEATHATLEGLGVETVSDLLAIPTATLVLRLGDGLASHLSALARGEDSRPVESGGGAKSLSVEQTYASDISGYERVETELLSQANQLGSRLRASGLAARTVSLKIRYAPFETITRSQTGAEPVDTSRELYHLARQLLERIEVDRPIRLVGLAATQLVDRDQPRQLGFESSGPWDELADTVEDIKTRFGRSAIHPARLASGSTNQESDDSTSPSSDPKTADIADPDRLFGPTD